MPGDGGELNKTAKRRVLLLDGSRRAIEMAESGATPPLFHSSESSRFS
jgi:hypothetical protein